MANKEAYKSEISAESTTKNDHTISTLDDFIDYGKKVFGKEITIKKSDNPDTYEKLFGATKADCISREFQEIVVEYPSICIYPEYKGKPYFSVKYKEGNDCIIGYGTYNPKVLSEYIRDYFLLSVASQEPKTGYWIKSNIGGAKICSVCNAHMGLSNFKFCPNCGAKMINPQESEDKE